MTLTLLLDLDDTLLGNDMDQFLPPYFHLLGQHLAEYVEPQRMIDTLLSATMTMMQNNEPDQTLEEVFDQNFYPKLGIPKETLRPVFENFYETQFPKLKRYTKRRPEASVLMEHMGEKNSKTVIATNPLFPITAIEQRVHWAGIAPNEAHIAWITSFETSHFAKPNPAYYAEILGHIGWPETKMAMIGNDLEQDIAPTTQLGIPGFWITNQENGAGERVSANGHGMLGDVLPWLAKQSDNNLTPNFHNHTAMLATLRATPAVVDTLIRTLPPEQWRQHPPTDKAGWNFAEIIYHMRDVETRVNLPRMQSILSKSNPFIEGKDTDQWVDSYNISVEGTRDAFSAYMHTRCELLNALNTMDEAAWARTARHAIFGPTTAQELVNFMAEHDRLHMRQLHQLTQAISA